MIHDDRKRKEQESAEAISGLKWKKQMDCGVARGVDILSFVV